MRPGRGRSQNETREMSCTVRDRTSMAAGTRPETGAGAAKAGRPPFPTGSFGERLALTGRDGEAWQGSYAPGVARASGHGREAEWGENQAAESTSPGARVICGRPIPAPGCWTAPGHPAWRRRLPRECGRPPASRGKTSGCARWLGGRHSLLCRSGSLTTADDRRRWRENRKGSDVPLDRDRAQLCSTSLRWSASQPCSTPALFLLGSRRPRRAYPLAEELVCPQSLQQFCERFDFRNIAAVIGENAPRRCATAP